MILGGLTATRLRRGRQRGTGVLPSHKHYPGAEPMHSLYQSARRLRPAPGSAGLRRTSTASAYSSILKHGLASAMGFISVCEGRRAAAALSRIEWPNAQRDTLHNGHCTRSARRALCAHSPTPVDSQMISGIPRFPPGSSMSYSETPYPEVQCGSTGRQHVSVPEESSSLDIEAVSEVTNRRLGAEIRRLRLNQGMTLLDIATETGLSASMLSMLERGKTGVSVGSLVAVASALGVTVGDLFQPSASPELSLVRFEQQQELAIGPGVTRRVVQRSRAHGLEVATLLLAPGADTGPELVSHEGQEIVVLRAGRLAVQIGGTRTELCSGDSIRLDAASPHRFANTGSKVADVLVVAMFAPTKYGH